MKKIISLIFTFIIFYFEFAIFVSDEKTVGKIGSIFALYSHNYLGYISYIFLIFFLYPIYKINFSHNGKEKIYSKISALFALFFSLIIFQSLVVKAKMSGLVGIMIIKNLSPYIGKAGLWIIVLITALISLIILFEDMKRNLFSGIKDSIGNLKLNNTKKLTQLNPKATEKKVREKRFEDKFAVKEIGDTAEIFVTKDEVEPDIILHNFDASTPNILDEENIITLEDEQEEQIHSLIVDELEENKKLLDEIELGITEKPKDFQLPRPDFFQASPKQKK